MTTEEAEAEAQKRWGPEGVASRTRKAYEHGTDLEFRVGWSGLNADPYEVCAYAYGKSFEIAFANFDAIRTALQQEAIKGELHGGLTDVWYLSRQEILRALAAEPS